MPARPLAPSIDTVQRNRARASHPGRTLAKVIAALSLLCASMSQAAQPVLQRGYDRGLSGALLTETALDTTSVSPATFGLVFKIPVDDNVFAQPLYVPNVTVARQGVHNVLYVATMGDTLYAFDADNGTQLWSVNFASRIGATPVPMSTFALSGNRNIPGNLGILSTPVIDQTTGLMYLVAATLENATMVYRLHAIDIRNGAEPLGPGTVIAGAYGGSTFDARYQTQRVSLAISGSHVIFAFGAMELEYAGGYTGWVMSYNKSTLQRSGIFATATAGNRGGGVWQSGRPPVVDGAGFVYVFTGNGYGSGYNGTTNFSESVLKLDPGHGLRLVDWFTAGNWSTLDSQDADLTSSGPLMIPGTGLIAGGGKSGDFYVLNSASLGKFNATDAQVVQKLHISASEFRGGPVFWQRSTANGGPLLYNWGKVDRLKAYAFNGTTFATSPSAQSTYTQIFPGGILTLSANGEAHGSGIIWATVASSGDAEDNPPAPGELHAFDAENVAVELWNSAMNPARDNYGNFAKFVPPLVANGRVYVATASNQVAVYGLGSTLPPNCSSPPPVLMGTQAIQTGNDSNRTGMAEAFMTSSAACGTVSSISVYLDATSQASNVAVGIYSDNGGHPGTLLTTGTTSSPIAGAWNKIVVAPVQVAAATNYWIAILGASGGPVHFRDAPSGPPSETSASSSLTALPQTWETGTVYFDGPLSAFAAP